MTTRWIVLALLVGCHRGHDDAGATKVSPASAVSDAAPAAPSILPKLPRSPDGELELRELDKTIAFYRDHPPMVGQLVATIRERITIFGRVEDYLEVLAITDAWTKRTPDDPAAWQARIDALAAVHRFADARALVDHLAPDARAAALALLAEATGDTAAGLAQRGALAQAWPTVDHVAAYGAALAAAGRTDDALAEMKRAATLVHDNAPTLFSWYLFQYGRVYELADQPAAARTFYVASRERLDTLEAAVHLAQTTLATGDPTAAGTIAREALTTVAGPRPYPDLLALAGRTDDARAGWERYVAALPEAFADHAARFYLTTTPPTPADRARALALARANLANRDTADARALVVEAALAATPTPDTALACTTATPLAAPTARRAHRFLAWKAFSSCADRAGEAARVAASLGIAAPAAPTP